ncbi:MAG TPA: FABP family protein [Kineosporiaceae bacterium]|nr:FABP family protein [Kineosporiaceae bacterium]
MSIRLDADLPAPLVPLAWLVGTWAGAGVVGYPTMAQDLRFGQEVTFNHDGRPFLAYSSRTWLLDADGRQVRPLASETGYWRPVESPAGASGVGLEVLLAHPTGIVEVYVGTAEGPRVTLRTDAVVRTATAKEYTAATRLYGLVEGDLLWVMDMAAVGRPLTSHASARLKRVPVEGSPAV